MTDGLDPALLEGIPEGELSDFLGWRKRVHGTNISEKTLLATDYLNHFNEIVMLIEMIPDMPDMLEECRLWEPKSYQQHFQDSGFSDKELAIAAYEHVPSKFRQPLEDTIGQMTQVVCHTLLKLTARLETGDTEMVRFDCQTSVEMIHRIIQIINGIIHGTTHIMDQVEIDAYLEGSF
ncbi:conserved hypothetical protein [uncultured Gammaproteobacteria bacterium]